MLIAIAAAAQSVSLQVINPGTQIQGRKFSVTFRASGGEAQGIKAPAIRGCKLVYGPSISTMHSVTIIQGKQTDESYVDYTFYYQAESAGSSTIPALSATIGGQKVSTQAAKFEILPPDRSSAPRSQYPPAQSAGGSQQPTQAPEISSSDLIVRTTFSKSKVYEQEPVIAEIKVYTVHNISSFQVVTQPVFDGFLSEELSVPLNVQLEHYNGKNYYTAVLKRCILYPQKAGKLTVNSGKYDVTVQQAVQVPYNYYFMTTKLIERKVVTTSNEVSLNVLALPKPQPAGFDGAVGQFTIKGDLSSEKLHTNEAANMQITINGTGNIKYLKAPDFVLPVGFDSYTPKTDVISKSTGNNISGTFTVEYPFMPQQVGQFEIPAVEFVYFDPQAGEYRTVSTDSYNVDVARGTDSNVQQTAKLTTVMTDIHHIHQTVTDAAGADGKTGVAAWRTPVMLRDWYWLIIAGLFVALLVVMWIYRRQLRLRADVAGRRLSRANRVAVKRLRRARKLIHSDGDGFYAELSQALYGYFGDKLGIPPSQLIRANIAQQLTEYGATPQTIDEAIRIIDDCEMARFTPEHSQQEKDGLYAAAAEVIKAFEAVKRK